MEAPDHPTCTNGFNRGRVFTTSDGANAVFTSDSDIVDAATGPDNDVFVSGYLVMRDGTRYRIDNSLVTWMRSEWKQGHVCVRCLSKVGECHRLSQSPDNNYVFRWNHSLRF